MNLTIEDYKKHIRKIYDNFIDTESEKEMIFIKMEIVNLLNKLNENPKKTTVSFLETLLNKYIENPKIKEEDMGIFLTHLNFFYDEMK